LEGLPSPAKQQPCCHCKPSMAVQGSCSIDAAICPGTPAPSFYQNIILNPNRGLVQTGHISVTRGHCPAAGDGSHLDAITPCNARHLATRLTVP
jgi:hypothetical protein